MNQNVEIILQTNDKGSDEYLASKELCKVLKDSLPGSAIGSIVILSNVTLFGQETKDIDLIVIGQLKNCPIFLDVLSNADSLPSKREVNISDFFFSIELKKHPIDGVSMQGNELLVRYSRGRDGIDYHSATLQSNKQRLALMRYFKTTRVSAPYIMNLIWLQSVTPNELNSLLATNAGIKPSNILPSTLLAKDIFQLAVYQTRLREKNGRLVLSSFSGNSIQELTEVFDLFSKTKQAVGELTRKRIELIGQQKLKNKDILIRESEELLVFRGKAGTGKTIRLLQVAVDLAENHDYRVLILTYNHALTSDIKRTLAFSDIPGSLDESCVSIMTIHRFFLQWLENTGLLESDKDYFAHYLEYIKEFSEYLSSGTIDKAELRSIIAKNYDVLDWDYILIDEAQDWNDEERDVLYQIYGPSSISIADGVDQFVRNKKRCDWTSHVKKNIVRQKICLRQRVNLVNFVNSFAQSMGMENWSLLPAADMVGGKVIVSTLPYHESDIHEKELESLLKAGNCNYDMLFLAPPQMVTGSAPDRGFSQMSQYKSLNVQLWDGTRTDLRTEYSIDLNQHRLFQYDSCRGLEGWTVVCLNFDDFLQYKESTYRDNGNNNELLLETPKNRKDRYLNSWAMLPLTRAIDTLVITIRDTTSPVCNLLWKLHQKSPDNIFWVE